MVVLGFSRDTRLSILLNSVNTDMMKDFYAARGAAVYALMRMSGESNEFVMGSNSQGDIKGAGSSITSDKPPTEGGWPVPTSDDNINEDNVSQDIDEKEDAKWVPDRNPYSIKIGNASCDVYLYDESGKININAIKDANRDIYTEYFTESGIDMLDADVIVDSILDWIDPDELTHINGAEDAYYESLPEPYKAKNAAFDSIEELTLVQGITPEIFENIRDNITVYGGDQIKINVNFASKETLSSIPGLSDENVDDLMLYIDENGPFANYEELRQMFWDMGIVGDSFVDIKSFITIDQSDFVTIRAFCKDSAATSTSPEGPGYANIQSSSNGYEYKLIAGRKDSEYIIVAVYPE